MVAPVGEDDRRDPRQVAGIVVEVADEHDRRAAHPAARGDRVGELEPARDLRSRAERVRPRVARIGRREARPACRGTKKRTSGVRSDAGEPGGSASYACPENTTRPYRSRLRASDESVAPIREYVSEPMLADRSSTTIVSALFGSATIVCECGLRTATIAARERRDHEQRRGRCGRAASGARRAPARERRRAGSSSRLVDLLSDPVGEGREVVGARRRFRPGEVAGRASEAAVPPLEDAGEQPDGAPPVFGRACLRFSDECERALERAAGVGPPRPSSDDYLPDGDSRRRPRRAPQRSRRGAARACPARSGSSRAASTYHRGTAVATPCDRAGSTRLPIESSGHAAVARATPPPPARRVDRAGGRRSAFAPVRAMQPSDMQTAGSAYVITASRPRFVRVMRAAPSGVSGATSWVTRSRSVSSAFRSASTTTLRDDAAAEAAPRAGRTTRAPSAGAAARRPRAVRRDRAARTAATAATAAIAPIAAIRVNAPTAVACAARPRRRTRGRSHRGRSSRATTGSRPSAACSASRLPQPLLVRVAPARGLPRRQAHERHSPAPRVRDRHADAADGWEALLPHRILDDDGHDVPSVCDRLDPPAAGGETRKSESTNTNVPGGRSLRMPARKVERLLDVVLGRVERRLVSEPLARRARRGRGGRAEASTARRAPARSSEATSLRAAAALATIAVAASTTARGFSSHGSDGGKTPIAGRRSETSTTRGASSAERSRTTNSSRPARRRVVRSRTSRSSRPDRRLRTAAYRSRRRRRRGGGSAGRRTAARRARRRGTSGNVCRSRAGIVSAGGRERPSEPSRARAAARARDSDP